MKLEGTVAVVTGGGSGLGRVTAEHLAKAGARVLVVDLSRDAAETAANEIGADAGFAAGDVADDVAMRAVFAKAADMGVVRSVVHCAGRGGTVRILDKEGRAGDLATYEAVVRTNLTGSFNVLRLGAEVMARNEPVDGDRGVFVLTASVAAYEGQIGQIPYASSKAGVVGMTIVAARDLAQRQIRVCTIAPGLFNTPMLARFSDEIKQRLASSVPHPGRLGEATEYARLAEHIISNPMLNGETIRLDGALRMQPK